MPPPDPDDFDAVAWMYDWLPVPTHPRRLAPLLRGVHGDVLDLGGGTARFTLRVFDGARHRVLVVDPAPGMLRKARRKRPGIGLVQGDGVALPLADASLAAVLVTEAFHHFAPHQDEVVREIARVLRPGGLLVVEEPDPTRWLGRVFAWLERLQGMSSVFHAPAHLAARLGGDFVGVGHHRTGLFTYVLWARRRPGGVPDA